jgi:ribose transport system permease protein
MAAGLLAGLVNGFLTTVARLPAFVATLGMFYAARGIAAWLSAGRQLSNFPPEFTLIGRKFNDNLTAWGIKLEPNTLLWDIASAMSTQTLILAILAVGAAIVLGWTGFGYRIYATGGNIRASEYAGINTNRVRFWAMMFSAFCASLAGVIYAAYLRSYNPSAGQLRELDAIAAVIIGGASVAGGFGTILGALAGAAVITLIRAVLTLPVDPTGGARTLLPPQMVGLCIGLVLIIAVLADIWLRQNGLGARLVASVFGTKRPARMRPPMAAAGE